MARRSTADLSVVPIGAALRLQPPEVLTVKEREFWGQIVGSVSPDHFRPADLPILAAYCQQRGIHDKALEEFRAGESFEKYNLVERAAKMMLSLARSLRLTPQSRMDTKIAGRTTRPETKPWEIAAKQA